MRGFRRHPSSGGLSKSIFTCAIVICFAVAVANAGSQPNQLRLLLGTPPKIVPFLPGQEATNQKERLDPARYAFDIPIEQATSGDIENDGQVDLVVLSDYEKDVEEFLDNEPIEYGVTFALSIYKSTPQGLLLLWSDLGALGYGYNTEASGVDSLGGIGDIDGSGRDGLLVRPGVSDVSFPIELLYWQGNQLEKTWSTDSLETIKVSSTLPNANRITGYRVSGISVGFVDDSGVRRLAGMIMLNSEPHSKLVYGHIADGAFIVTDIPSAEVPVTQLDSGSSVRSFSPPLGSVKRGGHQEVLHELGIIEGNSPPETRMAAVWTLISALAPSPGEPEISSKDFDGPAIISRFQTVLLKETNVSVRRSLVRLFRITKNGEFAPMLKELLKESYPDAVQRRQ